VTFQLFRLLPAKPQEGFLDSVPSSIEIAENTEGIT
jgi:hypothetical protein